MTAPSALRPLLLLTGGAIALAAYRLGQNRARTAMSRDGAEDGVIWFGGEKYYTVTPAADAARQAEEQAAEWRAFSDRLAVAQATLADAAPGVTSGAEPGTPLRADPGPLTHLIKLLDIIVAQVIDDFDRCGEWPHYSTRTNYWKLVEALAPVIRDNLHWTENFYSMVSPPMEAGRAG